MSHANATLAPITRERLARLIVDDGWPVVAAAAFYHVSAVTARKWAARWRAEGRPGMKDRSSRPHRCPHRTSNEVARRIVRVRWRQRLGPVQIGAQLGIAASTVHAVLVRNRLNRLAWIDRVRGEPARRLVRRYEHPYPGSLIHVDVTKYGNIPDGGGWRFVGPRQGNQNRFATAARTGAPRNATRGPRLGSSYVHTVIDDHSRIAYAEIHPDETTTTAVAVLHRAVAWLADHGVTVERVLSDNGSCYRSHAWRDACTELGITPKRTRPYRPQTNGKIERFHRTLTHGWAYARLYLSETERRNALPGWIHFYNHHRNHTAVGGPPITRLNNLPGHHS